MAGTEPFGDSVLVDVDSAGTPVGIELLTLPAHVDVDALAAQYRLPADIRDELRRVLGEIS